MQEKERGKSIFDFMPLKIKLPVPKTEDEPFL